MRAKSIATAARRSLRRPYPRRFRWLARCAAASSSRRWPARAPQVSPIDHLVIAGWTGRDSRRSRSISRNSKRSASSGRRACRSSIALRRRGSPSTTKSKCSARPRAARPSSSCLQHDGRLWVGAGSDHTDREVEKYGVSVSKQMCDKPIAPEFWPIVEVAPHWDKTDAALLHRRERHAHALSGRPGDRDARSADADREISPARTDCRTAR